MCITTGRLGFGQVKQPNRDVAQPGSALAWGARGREFESRHPDQVKSRPQRDLGPCCFLSVYIWFTYVRFCKLKKMISDIDNKGSMNHFTMKKYHLLQNYYQSPSFV